MGAVTTRAVVFDWRGTLGALPPITSWAGEALRRVGRAHDDPAASAVLQAIRTAAGQPNRLNGPDIDTNVELHRQTYFSVFADAGLDAELANSLYAVESDPTHNPFADDVTPTFTVLAENGCKIGVLSDIHFDLRPAFADAGLLSLVDTFVLSYEHGVQKPDLAIFRLALNQLEAQPENTLMVGDRASHDGAAVDLGIPTLLVPTLTDPRQRRLHLVTGIATAQ
ncbi:HAD family hydrolase [Nocardia sp. NPDC051052]|uniref:HAD family hydrolase n=1 Tax=Nocardia sp. NPDC051052 TaxID=3364322 RepID=UPI0037A694B7